MARDRQGGSRRLTSHGVASTSTPTLRIFATILRLLRDKVGEEEKEEEEKEKEEEEEKEGGNEGNWK